MERCPLCDSVGTVQNTPSGVPGCSRCGWTLDGSPAPPRPFIPTWKVLAPLVVPVGILWGTAWWTHSRHVHTPGQKLAMGLTFFLVGVWSGVCAYLWERLTPGFRRNWRPPHILTPVVLAIVFCLTGGGQAVDAAVELMN